MVDKEFFTKLNIYTFALASLMLLALGLIMLSSVSSVEAFKHFGNTFGYVNRQLTQGFGIGILALFLAYKCNYQLIKKLSLWILLLAIALLVLVNLGMFTETWGGAARWLHIGPVVFQPSEFAKIALIAYSASLLSRNSTLNSKQFSRKTLPVLIATLVLFLLIMKQPDLGSGLIILLSGGVMLFLGETNIKHLAWLGLGLVISTLALIKFEPYRFQRLLVFLNPSSDPQGIGYHINQSLIATGSGKLMGLGYGLSRQKFNFLPESYTDSIFAVMAEELGFIRTGLIVFLFIVLTVSGLLIARKVTDPFGKLLCSGLIAFIALQTVVNIGAISGLLPLTGITLPFFSYGSSSLVVTMACVGLILNIAVHKPKT